MSDTLTIVYNGESQLEYRRNLALPAQQRAYLDKLDRDMDGGITLANERIESPDKVQRAQFIAISLIDALQRNNDAIAAAACAYLADRLPDLQQVRVTDKDGRMGYDLVFDRPYAKEATLNFVKPGSFKTDS